MTSERVGEEFGEGPGEALGEGPGEGAGEGPEGGPAERPVPGLALGILYTALAAFLFQVSVNLFAVRSDAWHVLPGVVAFAVISVCLMLHAQPGLERARRRYGRYVFLLQALLTYLPVVAYHGLWGAAGGFLAASCLLTFGSPWNWASYTAVVLSMAGVGLYYDYDGQSISYLTTSTMLTGLMVFGLIRLVTLVVQLHEARGLLARLAVSQERMRFSRDLHDLLGYSLSAITLKSEVAIRLVPEHPERAVEELESVLGVSRQALSDVRAVATSYRNMSLGNELDAARAMLEAAGITVDTVLEGPMPVGPADTVLATVLREAVTNMLRHSKVQHCRVELGTEQEVLRLLIHNDGVSGPAPGRAGSGLRNLRTRVGRLGGSLTADRLPGGTFRVAASVPAGPVKAASPPPSRP